MQGNSSSIHLTCSYFLNVIQGSLKAKNSSNSLVAMEIYQQRNEQITSIGQRCINFVKGKVIKVNVWRHLNLRSCLTPKQAFECAFDQRRRINIRWSPASIFCWRCIGRTEKVAAINDRGTLCVFCIGKMESVATINWQRTSYFVSEVLRPLLSFARQSMTLLSGNIQSGNTGFSTVMKAFQCLCHKVTCVWLVPTRR